MSPETTPFERPQENLPSPEHLPTPEQRPEKIEPTREAHEKETVVPQTPPSQEPQLPAPPPVKDASVRRIESILEEGLADIYKTLDPATQHEFRVQGEEAASKISTLLQSAKVQVRKIISVITSWLKILPGVSQLFIEQEAKIKTDRLLQMRNRPPEEKQ